MQHSLLDWQPNFPHTAGYKEPTTSKENATRIEKSGRAKTLRDKVKAFFDAGNTATADEVAEILQEPFLAVRPRIAEIHVQGLIKPTGERRRAAGNGTCHVWVKA